MDVDGRPEEEINEEKVRTQEHLLRLGVMARIFQDDEDIGHVPTVYFVSGAYEPGKEHTYEHKYDLDGLKSAIISAVPDDQKMHLAERFQGLSKGRAREGLIRGLGGEDDCLCWP